MSNSDCYDTFRNGCTVDLSDFIDMDTVDSDLFAAMVEGDIKEAERIVESAFQRAWKIKCQRDIERSAEAAYDAREAGNDRVLGREADFINDPLRGK